MAAKESEGLLTDLPPLEQFLCRALRGDAALWGTLATPPEAEEFLEYCFHHGVQALLYHQMKETREWSEWPAPIRVGLEQSSRANVAQDLLRAHHLKRLLDVFADRGIRCLLTKGEAMAATHYPVPGTRPRCDSDVFIAIADVPVAATALSAAGFEIVSPLYKSHQFTVIRSKEKPELVAFDIHWRILNHPRFARVLGFEEAHARSSACPGFERARILHVIHALLLACLHRLGSDRHDPNRLIWHYDIHRLASDMTEDELYEFGTLAIARNVQTTCLDGIRGAQRRFNTKAPAELLKALATPEPKPGLSRRLRESNLGLLLDDWRHLPDNCARRALLRELFFPPVDSLRRKYGADAGTWRSWLYSRHILSGLAQRFRLR